MMTQTKIMAVGLAALVLAGCDGPAEINQAPVQYVATKQLNAVSTTTFQVRSYTQASGAQKEVTGVKCAFKGDGFSSSFVTPAVVTAPNMQSRTPPASVTCTYGEQTKTMPMTPLNMTSAEITNNAVAIGANGGLVGALVGLGVSAVQNDVRDKSADVWGYNSVQIVFD